MSRTLWITLLALLPAGCGDAPTTVSGQQAPSILFIVVDCLRADHVGAHGYERPVTPNIDALAAEGVLFTRAYSQASWTRPSLPTMLTGLYPSEHGLDSFQQQAGADVKAARLAPNVVLVQEVLKASGYRTGLFGQQFQLAPQFGLTRGFDEYHYKLERASSINGSFLKWLDAGPASAPFFAYLHYLDIHWPYCPPPTTRGMFSPDTEIQFCVEWRKLRDDINAGRVQLDEAGRKALVGRYDEELMALDAQLGALFRDLRSRGLWGELLVMLTSDHGEEFLERGMTGHGQTLHEELLAVPLVVKPPAAWTSVPGTRIDGLVELRDIAPTLIEAVGARVDPPPRAPSLIPWILHPPPSHDPNPTVVAEAAGMLAVRNRKYTLIAHMDEQRYELYERDSDPGELRDVSAERPEALTAMLKLLDTWRAGIRPTQAQPLDTLDKETAEGLKALGYLQ